MADDGAVQSGSSFSAECLNLRAQGHLPPGGCVYIQSGDPGDFDGYLIAIAGAELQQHTEGLQFVLVVPERRACPDRNEQDVNTHDEVFSEQVMHVVGRLARFLCPSTFIVRGPLNTRNVIPLKFIFSEPEKYGPLLAKRSLTEGIYWRSVLDLAALVNNPDVSSVVLDMNGSMGYLLGLHQACPDLGKKVKASGMPVSIMAGVLAEVETLTLRVPGRDPRATMNALYNAQAVQLLLSMASDHQIPLLFVTNNVCNRLLCYQDGEQLAKDLGLQGLLKSIALQWYGPHLAGKCVPFDWISLCAMVLHGRWPELMILERRQLHVGVDDPSVLVLLNPDLPRTAVVESQLEGTKLWGNVESVVSVDRDAMLRIARGVTERYAK